MSLERVLVVAILLILFIWVLFAVLPDDGDAAEGCVTPVRQAAPDVDRDLAQRKLEASAAVVRRK